MGYYVNYEGNIRIPTEKEANALAALKALDPNSGNGSGSRIGKDGVQELERHFAWVNTADILAADSVSKVLEVFGFYIDDYTDDGTLTFSYDQKMGDEDQILAALGPFVDHGGVVGAVGEDHSMWRIFYDGEKAIEQTGTVVYE